MGLTWKIMNDWEHVIESKNEVLGTNEYLVDDIGHILCENYFYIFFVLLNTSTQSHFFKQIFLAASLFQQFNRCHRFFMSQ